MHDTRGHKGEAGGHAASTGAGAQTGSVGWLKTHSVCGDVAHMAAHSPAVSVAKKRG